MQLEATALPHLLEMEINYHDFIIHDLVIYHVVSNTSP